MATTDARTGTTKKVSRKRTPPKTLRSFDPATGRVWGEIPANAPGEIADIVAHARKAAPEWAAIPVEGRVRLLKQVRHRIYQRLDDIVETVHEETGKPRAEALGNDVLPPVLSLLYLERTAPRALKPQKVGRVVGPLLLGMSSRIEWRPFGVVGAISPWNYPFSLGLAAVLPALFAGNTVVLKPSEVTPRVGELLRDVLEPLPPGVATVVQGAGEVGGALVDAPCDKLCFIGSPATGRKIAEAAAKHLTPVVMELGGMDPAIVLEDADLDLASSGVLWGAFVNAGQTCAASERAYVVDTVADEFTDKLLSKLVQVRHGSEDADIGPMTIQNQLDIVTRHVDDAVSKGARVLAGGPDASTRNDDGALWYTPTVLEGVTEDMAVSQEETFGPVLPIIRVRDAEDALRRANEDGFSLTASVYSNDRKKAEWIGRELRAGAVGINEVGATTFGAPWGPWGGVGESGYGRINGIQGLREFVYPVHLATAAGPRMKRIYWYPYDEDSTGTIRALMGILAAPDWGTKAGSAREIFKTFGRAIKNKL